MADVLTDPTDDLWPPTERTEAESPEVTRHVDSWIFSFLGSRVTSFSPEPDRVVVWCAKVPTVDAFTLPAQLRGSGAYATAALPRGWEPSQITMWVANLGTDDRAPASAQLTNPVVDENLPGDTVGAGTDLDAAVATIKGVLGLTDDQLQAATGVSRSTLWRLRTGRSSEARSVTEAPIWRLHALARAMTERIGVDGVRSWLHAGSPSPADLLRSGDLPGVERAADLVLFPERVVARPAAAVAHDDYEPVLPPVVASDVSIPRPKRVRKPREHD